MDIVDRLRAMGGYLDYDCEVALSFIADEIQTLRAKVASADVLAEALREITYSHDGYARKKAEQALATYDKLSDVK